MTVYKPKKLIPGHYVDPDLAGKTLVAVPHKKFLVAPRVQVEYEREMMIVGKEDSVSEKVFDDLYRPNMQYKLYYFIWKPVEVQRLF